MWSWLPRNSAYDAGIIGTQWGYLHITMVKKKSPLFHNSLTINAGHEWVADDVAWFRVNRTFNEYCTVCWINPMAVNISWLFSVTGPKMIKSAAYALTFCREHWFIFSYHLRPIKCETECWIQPSMNKDTPATQERARTINNSLD